LLLSDVIDAMRNGRSPLLLTERIEHLEKMANILKPHIQNIIVFKGGIGKKQLKSAFEISKRIPIDQERLIAQPWVSYPAACGVSKLFFTGGTYHFRLRRGS